MRHPQSTKSGPGRRHVPGHQKASPVAQKGAPMGFVQHTNPAKNARRAAKAVLGARQYRCQVKALARAVRDL